MEFPTGQALIDLAKSVGWEDNRVRLHDWLPSAGTSSTFSGVILSCYKIPGPGTCPECHGRRFDSGNLDADREAAWAAAMAHGHLIWFSSTEAGQGCMRRAIARARGDEKYYLVK